MSLMVLMHVSNQSYVLCALAILERGPQSLWFKSTGPQRLLAMVKSCARVKWQQRCEEWQRDDSFRIEVDWNRPWWRRAGSRQRARARARKPIWWTIDEPYKNAILFRLANQLKDGRNEKPLQVQYKYIWYEATANEYAEDFIIDFGASTHWDLQTLWVRNARVNYKTLKNTTRYQ